MFFIFKINRTIYPFGGTVFGSVPHTKKAPRKYLLNGWLRPATAYRKLF